MGRMRWALLALAVVAIGAQNARGQTPGEDDAALRRMHDAFVEAFIDSQGFGKRRVTPMMARMRHYQFEGVGEKGRCVFDVELVGVARQDPPVVHRAGFMGFQHRDDDAAMPALPTSTRTLQAWEREALARLIGGTDIVVQAGPGGERAMGPIRARPDCLACHRYHREGDVLGALSYGLGRITLAPDATDRRDCRPQGINAASARPSY